MRRRRWWIWVCTECGGLTAPMDIRIRCFVCEKPASNTECGTPEVTSDALFWACPECGGEGDSPPEDGIICVTCKRTINQVSADFLARSGMSHHEYVAFPEAAPS